MSDARRAKLAERIGAYLTAIRSQVGERFAARAKRDAKSLSVAYALTNTDAGRAEFLDWALSGPLEHLWIDSSPDRPGPVRVLSFGAMLRSSFPFDLAVAPLEEVLREHLPTSATIRVPGRRLTVLIRHEDLTSPEDLELAEGLREALVTTLRAPVDANLQWLGETGLASVEIGSRLGRPLPLVDPPGPPLSLDDLARVLERLRGVRLRGALGTRLALRRARVPSHPLPLQTAKLALVATLGEIVARSDSQEIVVIEATTGATKTSRLVDFVRVSPSVNLACMTATHDVAKQIYGGLGAPSSLPDRLAQRRFGIASAVDAEGKPLCARLPLVSKVLKAGGSPGLLVCPRCEYAPPRGGECEAFGGVEGLGDTALVTVHQLVPLVGKWAAEEPQPDPLLVVIDEPPDAVPTVIVTRRALTEAIETMIVASDDADLRDARKADREVRRRFGGRMRGPMIVHDVARASLPALMLAERAIERSEEDEADLGASLGPACRDLLRAATDSAWARAHGVRDDWAYRAKLLAPSLVVTEASDEVDMAPWITAATTALGAAVRPATAKAEPTEDKTGAPLTWHASNALIEEADYTPKAMSAVRAIRTATVVATWLAPRPGVPAAVARAKGDKIHVTGPNAHLVTELALPGHVVVLDATPDHVALEAAARWVGRSVRTVKIDVADGAPVERVLIYSSAAGRKRLAPGKVTDWSALGPLLVRAIERCETYGARCVLVVTYKPCAETMRLLLHRKTPAPSDIPHNGARAAAERFYRTGGSIVIAHFGAIKGINTFRRGDEQVPWEALDAVVSIGDHFTPVDDGQDAGVLLGLTEAQASERLTERAAAELGQTHGRLRAPVRMRPGLSIHIGAVVPLGWHRDNARVERIGVGRPAATPAMTPVELRALVAVAGGQRALARVADVAPSTITRGLTGERPISAQVAERIRGVAPLAARAPEIVMPEVVMPEVALPEVAAPEWRAVSRPPRRRRHARHDAVQRLVSETRRVEAALGADLRGRRTDPPGEIETLLGFAA